MMKSVLADVLDDLDAMTERTFLLLLPDRSLARGKGDVKHRWQLHRDFVEGLVDGRPGVTLIDLSRGRHVQPRFFRDEVHLTRRGVVLQTRAFRRALKKHGVL